MKYLYWFVNRFRPETRGSSTAARIKYIHDLFEQWCPHVVVSVHPLTQHAFARVLKELGLAGQDPARHRRHRPLLRLLEGLGLRRRDALPRRERGGARGSSSTTASAPSASRSRACPSTRSSSCPTSAPRRPRARELGLDPQKFTVFVNAGWVGGGNIPQIFRELVRGELDVQAIFLAGRNEELRTEAESIAAGGEVPRQGHRLLGAGRAVDAGRERDGLEARRPDHLRGARLPRAHHRRRDDAADAAGVGRGDDARPSAARACCLKRAGDIVPVVRRMVEDSRYYSGLRAATAGAGAPRTRPAASSRR